MQKLYDSLIRTIQESDSEPLNVILNAAANFFFFLVQVCYAVS